MPCNYYEALVSGDVVGCEAWGGVCELNLIFEVGPKVAELGDVFFCVVGFCDDENRGVGFEKGLPFIVDTCGILCDDGSVCGGECLTLGGVDSSFWRSWL